jgi:hypothetical protein
MSFPILNVELCAGVSETASQSLPPMTRTGESRCARIFLLPPAWSQWWWVFTMAFRFKVFLVWSRMGVTLG